MRKCGAIDNYGKDTYIGSAHVRSTAYRASLKEIEHNTGVSLDNFPICERVEVKADGSNPNRLVVPIKRYLSALRMYLTQWKPMYGSSGFLRLLSISNDAAEQATYDTGRAAETGG